MMCKIDHAAELAIPAFLCRGCHPELNRTPAQDAEFWNALRASQVVNQERVRKEREIARLRERIAKMAERGEPDSQSVNGQIYAGLCRKLARLELGEPEEW